MSTYPGLLRDPFGVPILVMCRDRLEPLEVLVDWLAANGYTRVILVDNASTYPPLLAYLETVSAQVVRLDDNRGPHAAWKHDLFSKLGIDGPFVVTDCDVVPDPGCPPDAVARLSQLLREDVDIDKAGLGLRIDDLPSAYALREQVLEWESQFWNHEVDAGVFRAPVDTTFALYRSPSVPRKSKRCLRTGSPYLARHLPWYADSAEPSEEEIYYRARATASASHSWSADEPSARMLRALETLRTGRSLQQPRWHGPRSRALSFWLHARSRQARRARARVFRHLDAGRARRARGTKTR